MVKQIKVNRPQYGKGGGKTAIGRDGCLTLASALVFLVATVAFTAGPVEVSAEESPAAELLDRHTTSTHHTAR